MTDLLDLIGGPRALVGVLIPLIGFAARRIYVVYVRYRIVGLGAQCLDVVLTASDSAAGEGRGITRPTTGLGSVQALSVIARAMGRYYKKLPFNVHLATRVESRLQGDLISVGGPRLNRITADLLRSQSHVEFDDVRMMARVGEFCVSDYDLQIADYKPTRDLGMVMICVSPFAAHPSRSVLCCGFTSYGTAGAAQWFFGEILNDKFGHPLARKASIPLRGVPLTHCYVAVLEVTVIDGRVIGQRVLKTSLRKSEVDERAGSRT